MSTPETGGLHRSPRFWGGLLAVSVAGIAALKLAGVISAMAGYILLALAMLLMIPVIRTAARRAECGAASPASVRYLRRIMLFTALYVVGLGIAVRIDDTMTLTGTGAFLVALLPAVPTVGIVATMGRYLVEETDEYLRHRAVIANIFGLGAVLTSASFWGFLETFDAVPHAPAWWAVPIWAMGMGAGQAVMRLRDRSAGPGDGE